MNGEHEMVLSRCCCCLLLGTCCMHGRPLTPLPFDPPAIKQGFSTRCVALPCVQQPCPPISQPPLPGQPAAAWETMQHSMLVVLLRIRVCGTSVHLSKYFFGHISARQGHCAVC